MKYRTWVISEIYYPEDTSTGYYLTKLAEGLAKQFQVNVLCSQPTYSWWGRRAITNELHNGVRIHRCWSTTYNKDTLPLRIINIATITLSVFLNCLFRIGAGDCVIVVTNPPSLPFAVLLASIVRGTKCILIVHDVYPEALVNMGIATKNSLIIRVISSLTRHLYKRMARIVVLGRDMYALVRKKIESADQYVCIIPNWADVDMIMPSIRANNPILAQLGLTNKFIIQYSGNIGRTHGISYLVDCAEMLKNDKTVHFLIIGFGGKKNWLVRHVKERELYNVTVMNYQPRSELPISLNACDISLISFVPGMAGVSVPSRMYNVMAAGKPIIGIADADSELARVIHEEDIGWVIAPGHIDELRMAILEARDNPGRVAQMGQRARRAAEAKYSYERVNKAYIEMVDSLYEEAT